MLLMSLIYRKADGTPGSTPLIGFDTLRAGHEALRRAAAEAVAEGAAKLALRCEDHATATIDIYRLLP
ncbi:MAG TPA: hypothetical protein VHU42_18435 [Rhodopila sp.]|jgi:hypothetical protein|nr:hypothetical protein [Rhodopila sp.]